MRELKRVLYVEDDLDIQAIARFALEELGAMIVATVGSGPEALAMGPEFAPDLILLDVMMPGMDGPSTLAALRQTAAMANVPVIFITAKAEARDLAALVGLGALGVIAKPFDPMLLVDRIRVLWHG